MTNTPYIGEGRIIDGKAVKFDGREWLPLSTPTQAEAKEAGIREALTPSAETKAAYWGEFSFNIPWADEDGNETSLKVDVPWTTIKEIMKAISIRALLTKGE